MRRTPRFLINKNIKEKGKNKDKKVTTFDQPKVMKVNIFDVMSLAAVFIFHI